MRQMAGTSGESMRRSDSDQRRVELDGLVAVLVMVSSGIDIWSLICLYREPLRVWKKRFVVVKRADPSV